MNFKLTCSALALCLFVAASPSAAQLLAAKDAPVAYGHHHLNVTSIPASLKFFGETLGGTPITVAGEAWFVPLTEGLTSIFRREMING